MLAETQPCLFLLLQHHVPLNDIVMYSILCVCSLRISGVLISMYIFRTASNDLSLVVSGGYSLCNNMLGELANGCLTVHVLL